MFGLFIIEAGQEPVALCSHYDNKPFLYPTGAEAAAAAIQCARGDLPISGIGYSPIKCQPRRIASDAWKARELGRFADGTYVALPWVDLPKLSLTAEHYAHVSTIDGAKIAYTQDAAKGMGDIQTRVKPGKYLQQFYGDTFDAPTIAKMAAEFSVQFGESLVLEFADTEDEIERVYVNGPSSCMAKPVRSFDSDIHPCRIYAAGDLAVAYMVRNDDITARVLCWPAKKLYGRIYGDECRIADLLEEAGFVAGDLDGARMLRIKQGRGFVVPYIDGCTQARDDGKHLIIGNGDVCGSNQNGLSSFAFECEDCSGEVDEDDCHSDDNGNRYCESCYDERFSYCEHDEETCEREGMREVITQDRRGNRIEQNWSENAVDHYATRCEGNRNYYDDALIVTLADGTQWSQDYFEDNGSICEVTGDAYANEDCIQLHDGTTWSKDCFAANGVTVDGENYAKGDEPDGTVEDAVEATTEAPKPVAVTLQRPSRIERRDNGYYYVMNGDDIIGMWCTLEFAQECLAEFRANALQVAA